MSQIGGRAIYTIVDLDTTSKAVVDHAYMLLQRARDHDRVEAERMDAEINARKLFTLDDMAGGFKFLGYARETRTLAWAHTGWVALDAGFRTATGTPRQSGAMVDYLNANSDVFSKFAP